MKRVAFLCEAEESASPSVWVNSTLLKPWLQDAGWSVDVKPPPGVGAVRRLEGIPHMRGLAYRTVVPALRRLDLYRTADSYDVVVVHKALTDMQLPPGTERYLRRRHPAIIFNFDDAVYERGIPYVPDRIALTDAVWVGRQDLAQFARQYTDNVYVIGSAVDCNHFRPEQARGQSELLELVWTGTEFSHPYLKLLRTPLERFGAVCPFRLTIVSGVGFSFGSSAINDRWVPYSVAAEREAMAHADVALMPLHDGAYERAKENYKVKIYLACGLPVICSPVGANSEYVQHQTSGWWASSEDEWLHALITLGSDAQLRGRLGAAGRLYVERTFDLPVVGPQVAAMFAAVAADRSGSTQQGLGEALPEVVSRSGRERNV
jgi:glycosyltransferase involved in cell wall biosynthesis